MINLPPPLTTASYHELCLVLTSCRRSTCNMLSELVSLGMPAEQVSQAQTSWAWTQIAQELKNRRAAQEVKR